MLKTNREAEQKATQAIQRLQEQTDLWLVERDDLQRDSDLIDGQYQQTFNHVASILLPTINRTVVEDVAKVMGAPLLLETYERWETGYHEHSSAVAAITQDREFAYRDALIDPDTGSYILKIERLENKKHSITPRLSEYDFPEFQYLYQRRFGDQSQESNFSRFMRVVTLSAQRETKAMQVIEANLGKGSFPRAAEEYGELQQTLDEINEDLAVTQAKIEHIQAVTAKYDKHQAWLDHFPETVKKELLDILAEHLRAANFDEIFTRTNDSVRVLLAHCQALRKKRGYLRDLMRFVEKQIKDREQIMAEMERNRERWAAEPDETPASDPTNWLVDQVEAKKRGTLRWIRFIGLARRNFLAFHRFNWYSAYMQAGRFLAFDAFTFSTPEEMPPDEACRKLFPEVNVWRQRHKQDKPDFSFFEQALAKVPDGHEWHDIAAARAGRNEPSFT
ncbi:hypothetical protein [Acanthopleuribacter pedis]|uniref:Uncharacterized protein n=1 Tax=Acanthopleuribacter pedis TaxID=442870 RepID=A0A8J7PZI8_9BACT|nr:hypothetical protein [Acanthopleuribacter pedis]MBO1317602.1 hypothetical protein [Acanthopleuribacter pedis]